MTKQDWARKLTSRKFWLAVAALVTGIVAFIKEPSTDAQNITALILALGSVVAYCIGEGLADAAGAKADPTVVYVPTDPAFVDIFGDDDDDEEDEDEEQDEEEHPPEEK